MTTEQFTQVVDAILEGKYSWACVLILRFAGYNPLHYIPYRTYNRLMKDNNPTCYQKHGKAHESCNLPNPNLGQSSTTRIGDLAYLESVGESHSNMRGGDRIIWLTEAELMLISTRL
ncbi:MAG: HetP family heterocyst commitment protein [Leptolyngbyaceae cyanobacterium SL_7_1]|nr:HetP family heterocyst commitment protein [Leptolyngbyaceae cyanobacterium SL_7_1]